MSKLHKGSVYVRNTAGFVALPLELELLGSWEAASGVLLLADFTANFSKPLGLRAHSGGLLSIIREPL